MLENILNLNSLKNITSFFLVFTPEIIVIRIQGDRNRKFGQEVIFNLHFFAFSEYSFDHIPKEIRRLFCFLKRVLLKFLMI